MVQKYRPTIIDGTPTCIPDQHLGQFVTFQDYQMDLMQESQDNQEKFQKAEGGFFEELDRLEETNKVLHARVKELEAKYEPDTP